VNGLSKLAFAGTTREDIQLHYEARDRCAESPAEISQGLHGRNPDRNGKNGTNVASEHYDSVPDLLPTAKSLAGGLPLSAVVGRAEIMDSSGLGGTFEGNPLALVVRDRETRERAKQETGEILKMVCKGGVIVLSAGTYGNVMRFLPPLVMNDKELEEGLDVIEGCLKAVNESSAIMAGKNQLKIF
jgi:acetylornithine/succinyldiaminopimelate/putrescine aminotransferase